MLYFICVVCVIFIRMYVCRVYSMALIAHVEESDKSRMERKVQYSTVHV